jgi:hypothetical protein
VKPTLNEKKKKKRLSAEDNSSIQMEIQVYSLEALSKKLFFHKHLDLHH